MKHIREGACFLQNRFFYLKIQTNLFTFILYFDVREMVIDASIDLVNRRKEAGGHFWARPGIKVINKSIKSRVENRRWLAGDFFLSFLKLCFKTYFNLKLEIKCLQRSENDGIYLFL